MTCVNMSCVSSFCYRWKDSVRDAKLEAIPDTPVAARCADARVQGMVALRRLYSGSS